MVGNNTKHVELPMENKFPDTVIIPTVLMPLEMPALTQRGR